MKIIEKYIAKESIQIIKGDLSNKKIFEYTANLIFKLWKQQDKLSKYKPLRPATLELSKGTLEKEMKNPTYLLFLKDNNKYVGFLFSLYYTEDNIRINTIEHIFLEKSYRNKSYGLTMIKMSIEWAKKNKCKYIRVGLMAGNETVISLYKKAGFGIESYGMRQNL